MRSNRRLEEQLAALEGAVAGLRGLDLTPATEDELAELLRRVESAARALAVLIARVADRLRQLRAK
ncbi:hypothetical protein [Nocardia arthritidis]|uniref:Uncharacterized protein n=1 Tax=Nocardia arthritidis TaxID=228602 RepID=A0A6G9YDX1_9NOCA|nr:hypothetical protein [Nocardia arthritidis]QIS11203.1 hypothetical protein F5544_16620 [Nocardia arthritidis]